MRGRGRLIAGLAVSAVFFLIALRGLKLGDFATALRDADLIWLLPGIGVYFLAVVARTWRWQYMLRHIKLVPMRPLFRTVCIGYMGNNIYPARAGEFLRSYVLKQEQGVRMSESLPTVLIERVFDGLTMLFFVFLALPFVNFDSEAIAGYQALIVVLTILFIAALFVLLGLAARPALTRTIVERLSALILPERHKARVEGASDRFMTGFASLARGREVFMIFGTSVLVWLFETGKYWFVMQAFDFEVSFFTLMLMNGVVNLATSIPGLPGHWGTFDLPGIAILVAAGVDRATATSYTLVLHVALWLPITLLGAYFLWRSHIDLGAARASFSDESVGAAPDARDAPPPAEPREPEAAMAGGPARGPGLTEP